MKQDDDEISHRTVTSELRQVTDSTFETTSNPAGSHESFSIFGDTACGEPLSAQQLSLNFTPLEEVDNEYVQKKCCDFWDYLYSRTDLHHLMVTPEKMSYDVINSNEVDIGPDLPEVTKPALKETTAVSMLEFVEGKGLIDRAFEAKLHQSMCSLGSREYKENELSSKLKLPRKAGKGNAVSECQCMGVCKSCKIKPAPSRPESSREVQVMCTKMTEWDSVHPKSMEPPGHSPPLSHCVMQRKPHD